jgi:hypothetical protein
MMLSCLSPDGLETEQLPQVRDTPCLDATDGTRSAAKNGGDFAVRQSSESQFQHPLLVGRQAR